MPPSVVLTFNYLLFVFVSLPFLTYFSKFYGMFSKLAYYALVRHTFGFSGGVTVTREECFLLNSASFGNVFKIRLQFYVTHLPLLSLMRLTLHHFLPIPAILNSKLKHKLFALHLFRYHSICCFLNINTHLSYFLGIIQLNKTLS